MSTSSSRKAAVHGIRNGPRGGAGSSGRGREPGIQDQGPEALDAAQQIWMARTTLVLLNALLLVGNAIHLTVDEPHEPAHPVFSDPAWNGNYDGSHIEVLGHVQLVAAAVVLVFLRIIRRASVYGAWALVVCALTADDLLQIHERSGAVLVSALELPAVAGLRAQDLGELAVWASMAFVLGIVVLIGHARAPGYARRHSWSLVLLVTVLAVFGVGVDQVHVIVAPHISGLTNTAMTLLETTGELVAMTLILLAAHRMALRPQTMPRPAGDRFAGA